MADFRVPSRVEVLLSHGREMRAPGASLAEIERVGDRYYLRPDVANVTGEGRAVTAGKILGQHVAAAAVAAEVLLGRQDQIGSPNKLVEEHLNQLRKLCTCGKRGFRDFAFGAIDRYGWAAIEYRCIFCGKVEKFQMDHSG